MEIKVQAELQPFGNGRWVDSAERNRVEEEIVNFQREILVGKRKWEEMIYIKYILKTFKPITIIILLRLSFIWVWATGLRSKHFLYSWRSRNPLGIRSTRNLHHLIDFLYLFFTIFPQSVCRGQVYRQVELLNEFHGVFRKGLQILELPFGTTSKL